MDYEQRKEEYRERIKSLRLIDDVFMSKVFDGNVEGATLLVRTILGKPDLEVTDVRTQEELKNLQGRSVRLDMLARDGAGRLYNIEVQRKDEGAGIKRASLHSALLVSRACEPGCEPVDYPEVYVIFITENDVLKKGRPLYRIEQTIVDDGEEVDDGEHVVYVNGECQNENTELGRLMHDLFCRDPRDMHNHILADRVKFFKENKEGVKSMCNAFQEVRDEGKKEGREETKIVVALRALSRGMSVPETAELVDLPIDAVEKLESVRNAGRASL